MSHHDDRHFQALYEIVIQRGTPSPSTPPAVAQGTTSFRLGQYAAASLFLW